MTRREQIKGHLLIFYNDFINNPSYEKLSKFADEIYQSERKEIDDIRANNLKLNGKIFVYEELLQKIARWELPSTGKTWSDGTPISYETEYGSNGARDYFKNSAKYVLKMYK